MLSSYSFIMIAFTVTEIIKCVGRSNGENFTTNVPFLPFWPWCGTLKIRKPRRWIINQIWKLTVLKPDTYLQLWTAPNNPDTRYWRSESQSCLVPRTRSTRRRSSFVMTASAPSPAAARQRTGGRQGWWSARLCCDSRSPLPLSPPGFCSDCIELSEIWRLGGGGGLALQFANNLFTVVSSVSEVSMFTYEINDSHKSLDVLISLQFAKLMVASIFFQNRCFLYKANLKRIIYDIDKLLGKSWKRVAL